MSDDKTEPSGKKSNAIVRCVSHPFFGGVLGIVGIALAIYFYVASRETPELTYYTYPVKTAVVRTGLVSRLSMQFDGQEITSDVTAAQVSFWNAGRRAIHGSTVLEPLTIRTAGNTRILEARLLFIGRAISGIRVDSSRLSEGEVSIQWNILEQNDGGVLLIVYAGDENVDISASAVLEGQPNIVRVDYSEPFETPEKQFARRLGWRSWVSVVVFFTFGILQLFMLAVHGPVQVLRRSPVLGWIMWLSMVGSFSAGFVELFFLRSPVTPFG